MNPMLKELDLEANELGPEAGAMLVEALTRPRWSNVESVRPWLRRLGVRGCKLKPQDESTLRDVLRMREEKVIELMVTEGS